MKEGEEEMVDTTAENDEVKYIFTAYEIDLDYEFDAPRFFDFSREETPLEVCRTEAWFSSAGSHPPSPYVARLVWREKTLMERTSSHMKPTASYLAKQVRPLHAGYSRSNSSALDKTSKSSTSSGVIENQAAKRQKLEGGLLRKDEFQYEYATPIRSRTTIPRDPNLETARRAQRAMERSCKVENVTSTVYRFKARPLNRKILETTPLFPKRSTPQAPDFQEFHLKTSERAAQHSSSVLNSTIPSNHPDKVLNKYSTDLTTECGSIEPGSIMNIASRTNGGQSSHSFKARAFNKKILPSKRGVGVFKNSKKETTTPMEFNFQTEKRFNTIPPVELFNKLSLESETQPAANPDIKEQ
ncbi:protein TPX2-like isoform X2 [Andrographis paniculata]|uniref:protein TPX2-like isoform X2 n=1 Tax=Andrographis paniculata TaxID=175694 RepID=UPI0021E95BE5|nr:protein TPX2-like isoform X2 [Andrographis paniculata]